MSGGMVPDDDPCCEECVAWRTGEVLVPMQRTVTVNVFPEYVKAYLDEGWTVIEPETKGARND